MRQQMHARGGTEQQATQHRGTQQVGSGADAGQQVAPGVACVYLVLGVHGGLQAADRQQQHKAQVHAESHRCDAARQLAHADREQHGEREQKPAPQADVVCAGRDGGEHEEDDEEPVQAQFNPERFAEWKAPGAHVLLLLVDLLPHCRR